MKTLVFSFCLLFLPNVFAVRRCYFCDGACENLTLADTQLCEELKRTKWQRSFLCESREYKTEGRVIKRCVLNNKVSISECDSLNLNEDTGCYHCDRELCNSGSRASAVAIVAGLVTIFYGFL